VSVKDTDPCPKKIKKKKRRKNCKEKAALLPNDFITFHANFKWSFFNWGETVLKYSMSSLAMNILLFDICQTDSISLVQKTRMNV